MIANNNESPEQVADRVREELDHLLLGGIEDVMPEHPENIESGRSGMILFLLEFYRFSGDARLLKVIEGLVAEVIAFCKKSPTGDYSLYEGRGGVLYALVDYYLLTGEEDLLGSALDLVTPTIGLTLNNPHAANSLYNGRAGTLLVILYLYQLTGAGHLWGYIDQFVSKIISDLDCSAHGLIYNAPFETNLRSDCSFAHGTAGIASVLGKVNQLTDNAAVYKVVEGLNEYLDSCWIEEFGNWGNFRRNISDESMLKRAMADYVDGAPDLLSARNDYGWANGAAGILLSSAPFTDKNSRGIAQKLMEGFLPGDMGKDCLYDGWAGVEMCRMGLRPYIEYPETHKIQLHLLRTATNTGMSGGLMHGGVGIWYSLICSLSRKEQAQGHILYPFKDLPAGSSAMETRLSISSAKVSRALVERYFPKSVFFLEQSRPDATNEYFALSGQHAFKSDVHRFAAAVQAYCQARPADPVTEYILDIFKLEKGAIDFFLSGKRTPFELFLEAQIRQGNALAKMNADHGWLMKVTLSLSRQISILYPTWDWTQIKRLPPGLGGPNGVNLPPASTVNILQPVGRMDAMENTLQKDALMLLDQFKEPNSVEKALNNIKHRMMSLPSGMLKSIVEAWTTTTDIAHFVAQIDEIILAELRQLVLMGILVESPSKVG